jgi:hypothetical protein
VDTRFLREERKKEINKERKKERKEERNKERKKTLLCLHTQEGGSQDTEPRNARLQDHKV